MGRDVSTHKELPRWTRNWPRQVLQLSCYQKKFNCYHTMNSLCLLDFIISHQEIILLPLSFCWSLWLLSFSQPPSFGKFQRFLTQARFIFFFQLSAPFSWLPLILSRGNKGSESLYASMGLWLWGKVGAGVRIISWDGSTRMEELW